MSYGELIGGRRFDIPLNTNAQAESRTASGRCSGNRCRASTSPSVVTARVEYVHNVRVPGMLHGAVVRPPAVGATLVSVDESSVSAHAGLREGRGQEELRRRRRRKAVAGAADRRQAESDVDAGAGAAGSAPLLRLPAERSRAQDTIWVDSGDVDAKLASAATVLRSTYYHPYQMHASIGSSCAVADVQSGQGDGVGGNPERVRAPQHNVAMVLGLQPEIVHVIFTRGSGCYGLNGVDAVSFDAALMSQAVGQAGARAADA